MNDFPTTNGLVRSRVIYRTFKNYRINELIFIQIMLQVATWIIIPNRTEFVPEKV